MKQFDERIPVIAKVCEDKKATDIRILDVKGLTLIADYFLIASGNSTPQVKAIADAVEHKMEEYGYLLKQKEGFQAGRWVLLDYDNIIVHIFHREDRDFYSLERLWADGKEIAVNTL